MPELQNFHRKYNLGLIFIFILIPLFWSCENIGDKTPDKNLVEAYKEVLIIKAKNLDSLAERSEISTTLEKYGFNIESFHKKIRELSKNQQKYHELIDSIQSDIKRELKKLDSSARDEELKFNVP